MPEHKEKFSIGYIYLASAVSFVFGLTTLYFGAGLSCKKSFQSAPTFEKLTILEVEEKYDIEILHPTVHERQEHINRHGGLRGKFIKVDGWDGDETKAGAKWLRCNQEAVKSMNRMAKGDKK